MQNSSPEYCKIPLADSFLKYLRYELNRANLTVEAYGRDIMQFANWNWPDAGRINFLAVTSSEIRAWMATLAREGDTPRTLRRKLQSLRAFYKWLLKSKLIDKSPLAEIALPKIPKPLPDLIKPDEIEEAIAEMKTDEEDPDPNVMMKGLVVEMLYSLGIRRAELISLDDADVSFPAAEIKVTGKRSKQRVIPLPQNLLAKIKAWQEFRNRENPSLQEPKPLFALKGKRITPAQVYSIVNKSLHSSSAKKKSPHALRHSFASAMLNGGADLDSVREFLGHASLATTQIYTHVSLAELKKAYSSAHPRMNRRKEDQ